MAIYFATGFQNGDISYVPTANRYGVSMQSGGAFFGDYALKIANGDGYIHFNLNQNLSEVWVTTWIKPLYYGPEVALIGDNRVSFTIADDASFKIKNVNNVVASSQKIFSTGQWYLAEFYVKYGTQAIASLYINGSLVATYTGNLTATYANRVMLFGGNSLSNNSLYNAIAVSDTRLGDIRFARVVPTSDVITEWTPSSGSAHYVLVDEVPPDSSDYIYATEDGKRDKFGMQALQIPPGATMLGYVVYVNGQASPGSTYTIGVDDGSNEATVISGIMQTDAETDIGFSWEKPSGGAWTPSTPFYLIADFDLGST